MRLLKLFSLLAARLVGLSVGLFFAVSSAVSAQAGSPTEQMILGTWITETRSHVTIVPCPPGYCGFITKVVVAEQILKRYGDEVAAMGDNIVDALNKDPALRNRPLQGLQILTLDPIEASADRITGQIYNPEDGETYDGFLEIVNNETIRLSGCVLFNLICRGEDWKRVPLAMK